MAAIVLGYAPAMAEPALVLYQAEWCAFSSAVREVMTELGLDFVARQVEPWPKQRKTLRELAGTDVIPALQIEDGRFFVGAREIFDHLRERPATWERAAAHRRRFESHRDARETDVTGQLLVFYDGDDELEGGETSNAIPVVVRVPRLNRYELHLDGSLIGYLVYRRRDGRIVYTHTEVDPAYSGRGYGGLLVGTALDEAAHENLEVVPLCPFLAYYIDDHPKYEKLVARDARAS
jgi:predicted GNAT family acetyltransferase